MPLPSPAGHLHIERATHPHFPLRAAHRSGALAPTSLLRDFSWRVLEGQVQGIETPIPDGENHVILVDESNVVGGGGGGGVCALPAACRALPGGAGCC